MKFEEPIGISPGKIADLRARIARLRLDLSLVEESFTKGGGKGGQKINKTSNAVVLRYAPLNLVVKCQRERQRSVNRFLALRELVDRVEAVVSPSTSRRMQEEARVRRQKDRRRRRFRGETDSIGAPA
jgi:protein subunit release factor B